MQTCRHATWATFHRSSTQLLHVLHMIRIRVAAAVAGPRWPTQENGGRIQRWSLLLQLLLLPPLRMAERQAQPVLCILLLLLLVWGAMLLLRLLLLHSRLLGRSGWCTTIPAVCSTGAPTLLQLLLGLLRRQICSCRCGPCLPLAWQLLVLLRMRPARLLIQLQLQGRQRSKPAAVGLHAHTTATQGRAPQPPLPAAHQRYAPRTLAAHVQPRWRLLELLGQVETQGRLHYTRSRALRLSCSQVLLQLPWGRGVSVFFIPPQRQSSRRPIRSTAPLL